MLITRGEAVEKLLNTKGQLFGVTFVKKNKELRNMAARLGVRKGVKGVQDRRSDDSRLGLLTAFDFNADFQDNKHKGGFRRISLDRIMSIRVNHQKYEVL